MVCESVFQQNGVNFMPDSMVLTWYQLCFNVIDTILTSDRIKLKIVNSGATGR